MKSKNSWIKHSSKAIFTHPRLTIMEDSVELPDGTRTNYLLYSEGSGYVTLIAIRSNGDLAMLSEYSYPLDQDILQFPEGRIDDGESAEVSAHRELKEEIGISAGNLEEIGTSPRSHRRDPGLQHVFIATDLLDGDGTHSGDAEEQGLEVVWLPETEVTRRIACGEIFQKNTLAAWAMYCARLTTMSGRS